MADFIPKRNISFNGGNLSSDTGAILPLDFIFNNELFSPYKDLPFDDARSYIKPSNSNFNLLKQCVCRFLLGYPIQADQQIFFDDPILQKYFPQPSSQASVSRFYGRAVEDTSNAFATAFMDQSCSLINSSCRDLIFDGDSTKTDTYGKQEDAAWIHHYEQVGYHPIVVNEFNTKLLAASFLRPGATYSADEAVAVMNEVLSRISDMYKGFERSISFRGDAAFYNSELMDLFEDREHPVRYAIRSKGTGRLNGECIDSYYASEHEDDAVYTAQNPYYGEITYKMTNSDKYRRVCFKLFFTEEEEQKEGRAVQLCLIPHVFAVMTNDAESSVIEVINFYCQRGASENFTKELKGDFFANTLSHARFHANALEFFMKSLAYNLFHIFQLMVLEGSDRVMTADSFRKKYQKIASRLSEHARSFYLKIARSFRHADKFMKYLERSRSLRL